MKKLISALILFNFTFFNILKASQLDIIQGIEIEPNYIDDGVHGMKITYRYNFLSLEEEHHNDTLLQNCTFTIKTKISENGKNIGTAKGFKSVTNQNGDLEFTIQLIGSEIQASKYDKLAVQFIPFAALNLMEGEHNLAVKAEISGKDATGFLHNQKIEKSGIVINKPITKTFTMNIDYLEVNTLNSIGQAWDYGIFKTDAPDVGINIMVGNVSVWKSNVNDTYMFAVGPNSKNISFTISKNDKVIFLVQDIDVMFNDFIAKWSFSTNDKKIGSNYNYNKAKGNVKSCNLSFRID